MKKTLSIIGTLCIGSIIAGLVPLARCPAQTEVPATMSASRTLGADYFVYFGSHGIGPDDGFALAHFDSETGILTTPQFLMKAAAPAYFLIDSDGEHLYVCNSAPASDISAYSIDPATAKLTPAGEPVKLRFPFCERFLAVGKQ
jgi:hypothetical protein